MRYLHLCRASIAPGLLVFFSPTGFAQSSAVMDDEEIIVTATVPLLPGSQYSLEKETLEKRGANDFCSIMRYEPLIHATGSRNGSGKGKSGFDRGGYTGYNVRGLEGNRVSLDIDGIAQPDATGRSYAGRAGLNTFGIGRDYMDPWLYSRVGITAGPTRISNPNTAIGGAVSFRSATPEDYLTGGKNAAVRYSSLYDSTDRSLHNGVLAAGGDYALNGLVAYSRRDGQETQINNDGEGAYPANWHSNAWLASGSWRPSPQIKWGLTLDGYERIEHNRSPVWDRFNKAINGEATQQNITRRWGAIIANEWQPALIDQVTSKVWYQQTQAHDATRETTRTSQESFSDYNVKSWGGDTRLDHQLGIHRLSAGMYGRDNRAERPFRQQPVGRFSLMPPEADSRTLAWGGFVEDSIGIGRVTITPGLKFAWQQTAPRHLNTLASSGSGLSSQDASRMFSKTSDSQWLPGLALQYALSPRLMTYLEYQRGAQFPTTNQRFGSWNLNQSYAGSRQYALVGNPDLKTETSDNLEWGLKGQVGQMVDLRMALFYNRYQNFIAYDRLNRTSHPEAFARMPAHIYTLYENVNRDKAYIYGAELAASIKPGAGLTFDLAVGYSQGKAKSHYSGDSYVDLDSVPPAQAVLGVSWANSNNTYGTGLTGTFVKGKRAQATNRERYMNQGQPLADSRVEYQAITGYGLVDATGWWRVTPQVKLTGGIYNLGDRRYREYLSNRQLTSITPRDARDSELSWMPGRTFQLGVNYQF